MYSGCGNKEKDEKKVLGNIIDTIVSNRPITKKMVEELAFPDKDNSIKQYQEKDNEE